MVWLATRYWRSKRSDHVLHNTIARSPKPAVNISDNLNDKIFLYGKKSTPRIRINRVLAIRIYRNLSSFYRPNPITLFILITPSKVTSSNNNYSKISMSRETYPVDLLPHREEPSQLCFQSIYISISNCLHICCFKWWNIETLSSSNFCSELVIYDIFRSLVYTTF